MGRERSSGGLVMQPIRLAVQLALLSTLLVLPTGPTADAADLREGVEQLAAAIAKGMPENRQARVAVTDFADLQGFTSDLGRYIAERLTTRLAQSPRFRVIERRRLGQVLVELKFGMSDLVDPEKAKQLGRIAGVEGLVVGSISDLGNTVEIDTRLIEIDTGNMLVATTATISKDDTVRGMYERGRELTAVPGLHTAAAPAPAAQTGASVRAQEFPQLRVLAETVQQGGRQFTVFLVYQNKTQEDLLLKLGGGHEYQNKTRLHDDQGTDYRYESTSGLGVPSTIESALLLPALGRATATVTFHAWSAELKGKRFSFSSEQNVFRKPKDPRQLKMEDLVATYNISFRDIERK
jgi:TolB-like protein